MQKPEPQTTHELKIERPYFLAVKSGEKTFEIRNNDRGYQKGDKVILRELDDNGGYSGHRLSAEIGYVLWTPQICSGNVCFSLLNVQEQFDAR